MTTHTQKGSVSVDAYQWLGGTATVASFTSGATVGTWLKRLALHTPGDGSLHVPTTVGTLRANPTDWVALHPDGSVSVLPNATFTSLYN